MILQLCRRGPKLVLQRDRFAVRRRYRLDDIRVHSDDRLPELGRHRWNNKVDLALPSRRNLYRSPYGDGMCGGPGGDGNGVASRRQPCDASLIRRDREPIDGDRRDRIRTKNTHRHRTKADLVPAQRLQERESNPVDEIKGVQDRIRAIADLTDRLSRFRRDRPNRHIDPASAASCRTVDDYRGLVGEFKIVEQEKTQLQGIRDCACHLGEHTVVLGSSKLLDADQSRIGGKLHRAKDQYTALKHDPTEQGTPPRQKTRRFARPQGDRPEVVVPGRES